MASLPTHGRYGYRPWPERSRWTWPNGAGLAVYLGVNLEHFAFGEGLGAMLVPTGPAPDVANHAWRDYGNRVGAWRVLELLDSLALPCTVLLNGAVCDYAPTLVAAHVRRGDEIAGHGRTNSERQGALPEAAERALIAESTATLAAAVGRRPLGWLSPWISESRITPDLLAEAGYDYTLNWCHDDQPTWLATRGGRRLLSVPYPQEINDIPSIIARLDGPDAFAAMIVADLEERLDQVARDGVAQVMGVALHPYIFGQPYRLRALRRALGALADRRDAVWLTTAGTIAEFAATLPEGAVV